MKTLNETEVKHTPKFTPGPWTFNGMATITAQDDLICIATVDHFEWRNKEDEQRREANAHLIAAAPDLLEACKAADETLSRREREDQVLDSGERMLSIQLRAAIALAEGRSA